MERWLSGLYVAVVLALGLVSLWPKLGVQFAPTEVRVPMRPAASGAALPYPTAKPPAPPQAKEELPPAPAATQPKPFGSATSTPLSAEALDSFKNPAVSANSARTLTPGPVRRTVAKVNLNTASQAELESLPRVGPAMAKRIIQGRPYRSLDDLDKVKGVGPKTLEVLAPLVSF